MKEVEFKMTADLMQALFQGKRVTYLTPEIKVTIFPPNHGVFLTHENYSKIKRSVLNNSKSYCLDELQMFEKIEEQM